MGSRVTPPPTSKPPQTGEVDETWDEVFGALGDLPPAPDSGGDVFDRPTAIPTPAPPPRKLSELKLDLESRQPGPVAAPTAPAGPRASKEQNPDRARTSPEPVVERFLSRVEQGQPSAAHALQQRRKSSKSLELDMSQERSSPLDLVEDYRRGVDSSPNVRASPSSPSPGPTTDRPSGNFSDMQDRYAVGDFTGALVVAESILDANPDDEDAKRYAQSCREVLTQMYAARIGPMDQIATVAVPPDQITWLSLDHRAGFLLSLVDGVSSIEEILDISGMSRLDALRIMYTLVQQNVVTLS